MSQRPKYVIGIFSFLLLSGSLATGFFCRPRPGSSPIAKAEGFISSAALSSSFDSNEALSDSLYLYKVLSVRGTIQKIVRRESGNYVITLDGPTPGRVVVDCNLDSVYSKGYLSLRNGDSVTLRGTCAGRLLNVILMQCIIEN
ncbi:MAG: hypothetical protein JST42_15345 [Bacteroidetes bacterium]|nr:hypothetical protein [Bacteroidota bacterium]